jgi:MoaA/NifB/PqqE/SkfB family radical SAM enzyme
MDQIYRLIRLNKLISNHRAKFGSVLIAHVLKIRHLFVRFDPVMACNLRCTMCYFSNDEYKDQIRGVFTEKEVERIASLFFSRTLQLVIGCGTEPTLFRNFPELVRIAKGYKIPYVGFTSNGQLLTEPDIERLIRFGLDEITLSVHGITPETYSHFMVNSSYDRFHEVLRLLQEMKKKSKSEIPHIRLNYTVNPDNLDELRSFFEVFGSYEIRTLQVRPIIDFVGTYRNLLRIEDIPKYNMIVGQLTTECKKRGILFLANKHDPRYQEKNYNSVILQAVRRHITPQVVWRPDFDWKNESYDDYCRRIGWSKHLRTLIASSIEEVARHNAGWWGNHSAKYDVIS